MAHAVEEEERPPEEERPLPAAPRRSTRSTRARRTAREVGTCGHGVSMGQLPGVSAARGSQRTRSKAIHAEVRSLAEVGLDGKVHVLQDVLSPEECQHVLHLRLESAEEVIINSLMPNGRPSWRDRSRRAIYLRESEELTPIQAQVSRSASGCGAQLLTAPYGLPTGGRPPRPGHGCRAASALGSGSAAQPSGA